MVIQSGSGNEVRNNVWYNSVRTNNSFSGTISNNWYYNTVQDGDSGASKTVCTSNCDIFTSLSGKDFSLKVATRTGLALSSGVAVDPNGVQRGADGVWDLGAFEYRASTAVVMQAPSGLTVR